MGCFLTIVMLAMILSSAAGREVGLSMSRQQGLASWFEAIGTITAAAIALFQNPIRQWISRPILRVSIRPDPPDCMMLFLGEVSVRGGPAYWSVPAYRLRLRVKNLGKRKAENVQVRLDEVRRKQPDGSFAAIKEFPPMNLCWANGKREVLPMIYPRTDVHCNLAHILKPSDRCMPFEYREEDDPNRTILSVDTFEREYSLPHLLKPGSYRLLVTVSSADTPSTQGVVDVDLKGQWYCDGKDMRTHGVTVHPLS